MLKRADGMRAAFASVLVVASGCLLTAANAGRGGVAPGKWEIAWLEPRLTPASRAHETSFTRCYSPAEAARGANPLLPPAHEPRCKTSLSGIGGDIVYDTDCGAADHRLRLFACGTGYCGVYRYVPRRGSGETGILESIVLMRPGTGVCEPA